MPPGEDTEAEAHLDTATDPASSGGGEAYAFIE